MENKEVSGRDNYINCDELWMNIISSKDEPLNSEQRIIKRTFSAAAEALKGKCLLFAALFGLGLVAVGAHMLFLVFLVSDGYLYDFTTEFKFITLTYYECSIILDFSAAIPVLLLLVGTLMTFISARRNGETMGYTGLVLTQIAAVLGVLIYAAIIILEPYLPIIIPAAVFILMWVTVFFSARSIKLSLTLGTPKRIPFPMVLFCVASAISSALFAIVFLAIDGDFLPWERAVFGTLSICALIASFCFQLFIVRYNREMSYLRKMAARKEQTQNPLFTIAE